MPADPLPLRVAALPAAAAGEVLTLQRAAFVSEAQLYDDTRLPALVQTLDELRAELVASTSLGAWLGPRLVGAVRSREDGDLLRVGRLTVAPDLQGRGIGSRVLTAAEGATLPPAATLFTGSRSAANLRLYQRLGYTETAREEYRPGVELCVHLTKQLR